MSRARALFVYILASETRELYIGMTNNLQRRIAQHRSGIWRGYALEHRTFSLVHYEQTANVRSAIDREKQLKLLRRSVKIEIIERGNPEWRDLSEGWL